QKIRRSIHLLSLTSLAVVALAWAVLFVRETYIRFEEERERIAAEYLEQRRAVLRERVDNVAAFILSYREEAESQLRRTVRSRVEEARVTARAIAAHAQDRMSEEEIQRLVVEALRPLRWRDGNSYI